MRLRELSVPVLILLQGVLVLGGLGLAWPAAGDSWGEAARQIWLLLAQAGLLGLLAWRLRASRHAQVERLTALNLQLNQALKRAQDVVECSNDLVWEVDASGRFTIVSDHNGVEGVKIGDSVADLAAKDPVTPPEIWVKQIASNAAGEPFRDFRYSLRRADGSIAHFLVNGVPIHGADGTVIGFRGASRDRTVEIEALQALNYQALHDTLTGLPNRRSLTRRLDPATRLEGERAAVLLLDLDGFKTVNDVQGHAAGDALLCLVAGRLNAALRPGDIASRLGGDEFALVLAGADAGEAMALAQSLVQALVAPYALEDGTPLRIGVSIGIALLPEHGQGADALLRCADLALYAAKHGGGSGARLYGPPSQAGLPPPPSPAAPPVLQQLRGLATLPAELQQAIAENALALVYQPIRRCADGSVAAIETLLRWHSPGRGPVAADVFIPVAEETGLIVPIGAWVLRQACGAAARAGGSWRLSVNISPVQFSQPELVPLVAGILRDTGLPAERLMLELTEQMLLSRFPSAAEKVRKLRAMGVSLALDDFGAGFANLAALRDIRFDLLKLDRSVLRLTAAQRGPVLASLLQIARAFDLPSVVEGVEQSEDWALARQLGSDYAQGYLLGRPQHDLGEALALPVPG
ncbi:putative bifunctional diguanylate cyclase/phosphodiesterase [Teichococcus deserti]|uniref:putative bifunctional diguanylate cyclase/phosphodiesterase n=1 Tax=Teichococcus deserti TaxID=1817963 RepID=UPI0009FAE13F|nr:EAL domain-containing protein [Pseudoroseomonas deserti]